MAKISSKGVAWIIISVVILAIGIIYMLTALFASPYKYDWRQDYNSNSEEPYGLALVIDLLDSYDGNNRVQLMDDRVRQELPVDDDALSNYVFIGANTYYDSLTSLHIINYLKEGNTVFIASQYAPYQLLDHLSVNSAFYTDDYNYTYSHHSFSDTAIYTNFNHPALKRDQPYSFRFQAYGEEHAYHWGCIAEEMVYDSLTTYARLDVVQDTAVGFVRVNVGSGKLLIHANPLLFTNLFMAQENGIKYFNGVFSHLNSGDIYWDEASKLPDFNWSQNQSVKEGPFRYILSQPALRNALYLALALVILYVLFRAKREQKTIPVIEQPENTSLDFLKTVGTLYYLQQDHRKLAEDQWNLFLAHIRERYHLPTKKPNEAFYARLTQRSEISRKQLERTFEKYNFIKDHDKISEDLLSEFYQLLQHFYTNAK